MFKKRGSARSIFFLMIIVIGGLVYFFSIRENPSEVSSVQGLGDETLGQESALTVAEVNVSPSDYLSQEVTFEGVLGVSDKERSTGDYWLVLEDDAGDSMYVAEWLPSDPKSALPIKQSDYFDRKIQLTGEIEIEDEVFFLKVKSGRFSDE